MKDRTFMSSKFYKRLIDFLSENENENSFGMITYEGDKEIESGLLIYGKYLGMIFTMFSKDQKAV